MTLIQQTLKSYRFQATKALPLARCSNINRQLCWKRSLTMTSPMVLVDRLPVASPHQVLPHFKADDSKMPVTEISNDHDGINVTYKADKRYEIYSKMFVCV